MKVNRLMIISVLQFLFVAYISCQSTQLDFVDIKGSSDVKKLEPTSIITTKIYLKKIQNKSHTIIQKHLYSLIHIKYQNI